MTGSSIAESAEADLVGIVDQRRAEGLSVAAACREAGISTSTYYRRRRTGAALADLAVDPVALQEDPPATVGLLSGAEDKSWPFTARAPFYWDQVFSEELSDSFVRREFGRGPAKASAPRALTALAAPGLMGRLPAMAQHVRNYLPKGLEKGAAAAPLAAAAVFALIAAAAVLTVSVAADPAAWINPAQTRVADTASATLNP